MGDHSSIVGYWSAVNEIEEESRDFESSIASSVEDNREDIYVAVGESNSSLGALAWALKHVVTPSSFVYLIHVFPEVHFIPTLLGNLPKSQVNPSQVESHMSQERNKRRILLEKFLSLCTAFRVRVDTVLIESDVIEKAVLDLIPVLHIRTLVLGTTKSNLRRGTGKAGQIKRNAPNFCQVKIICEGREVNGDELNSASSSVHHTNSCRRDTGLQDEAKRESFFRTFVKHLPCLKS